VPVEAGGADRWLAAAAQKLGISEKEIMLVKVLGKSLAMDNPEQFYYELSLAVAVTAGYANPLNFPVYSVNEKLPGPRRTLKERPIIIGFGPAGMFAALELIEYGLRPLIFERGKKIEERSADVRRFAERRVLDPGSNIQFGEGGAGAYSDGKLFSRADNSCYASKVLSTFIKFGAAAEIGYTAKPHIGTDVLCGIVRNIREYVLKNGGEIHYGARMTDLLVSGGRAAGVVVNGLREYHSSNIYLAIGHSARDTFNLLQKKDAALERRGISVGLRIEHPARDINLFRYGAKYESYAGLGAAVYSLSHTDRQAGRGVYTFCMCPGGEVVNASCGQGLLVVNGMSYAARASEFSNAALVVTCHPEDYGPGGPLAGFRFQEAIESRAFRASGGNWSVPAQNLMDFLRGKISGTLNRNSCRTGTAAADLRELLPDFVTAQLLTAFGVFKKKHPAFVTDRAVLLAPETRTSCPVKVLRGENYGSLRIKNLYPIGEGAGYAGGITSSAIDAIKGVEHSFKKT
jgi:uncharacterized FAD-dependent dehydrogenase